VLCCPSGNYAQALDIYARALQHCPDSARVLVNASLALLRLSRPDDAFDKASLAIGLQPGNSKAFHARHKAKEALGDFKVCACVCSTAGTMTCNVCRHGKRWRACLLVLAGSVSRSAACLQHTQCRIR
jgi:tetratricopeptide (TPR) repeat protein